MTTATTETKTRRYIRMSSAGKCRRQIGYDLLGYTETDPTPTPGRNVMELGDAAEEVLIHCLREEGWEVDLTRWDGGEQLEVALEDPPRVGHPDGRCRHPQLTNGLWVLLECKGMNAFQFRSFLREGFPVSHPQYIGQVAQYGRALYERDLVIDPCAAVAAALDRDTGRWDFQRIRWEQDVYARRTVELAEAWALITEGRLPGRDHDGTTWHCNPRYCRWSSLCWEGARPALEPLEPGEGTLDGMALPEAADLLEASQAWRDGKDMENTAKAMQEGARDLFKESLERHRAKKLLVDGLSATLVPSSKRSWDEKLLKQYLTEEQIRQARRQGKASTSLRVVDTAEPD